MRIPGIKCKTIIAEDVEEIDKQVNDFIKTVNLEFLSAVPMGEGFQRIIQYTEKEATSGAPQTSGPAVPEWKSSDTDLWIDCPKCGKPWNIGRYRNCRCGNAVPPKG